MSICFLPLNRAPNMKFDEGISKVLTVRLHTIAKTQENLLICGEEFFSRSELFIRLSGLFQSNLVIKRWPQVMAQKI